MIRTASNSERLITFDIELRKEKAAHVCAAS